MLTPTLDTTAEAINAEYRQGKADEEIMKTKGMSAINHYVRCGELLLEQKNKVKFGKFQRWVEKHCEFSYQTAADYMRAAEHHSRGSRFSSLADMKRQLSKPRPRFITQDFETPNPQLPEDWPYMSGASKMLSAIASSVGDVDPLQVIRGTATSKELRQIEADADRINSFIHQLKVAAVRKRQGQPEAPYDRETATTKLWSEGRGLNS